MLYPYARRVPPHAPCALDRWIGPGWRFLERHAIEVAASPGSALGALARLRMRELPAVRALLTLRGMRASPDTTLIEFFSTTPFVLLDEIPDVEFVGGILLPERSGDGAGPSRRFPGSAAEFRSLLRRAPFAAIATFRAERREAGTALWTETWVRTRGITATALFSAYWVAIGPFSAWIRRIFLREARRRVEDGRAG